MNEFKYCIKTVNGTLLTNDLGLVREFLGLTKLRPAPPKEPAVVSPEIFPNVVETSESFMVRHPHSSSTITKTKVNEIHSIVCDIYTETKKPVHWKEIASKTEISDVNLKRALFILKTRGNIKSLKVGRKRLFLPMSAEYVLDEVQRSAVNTVGKALKEEWKTRGLA